MHLIKSFGEFFSPSSTPTTSRSFSYDWSGQPLILTKTESSAQKCRHCQSPCYFEFQLMPALVNYLKIKQQVALEFGTVFVYTCSKNCWKDQEDLYRLENVFVQADPDQSLFDWERNQYTLREREHLRPSISLVFQMIEQLCLVLLLLVVLGLLVLGVRRDRWRRMEWTCFISRPFVSFVPSEWHLEARTRKSSSIRRPPVESHFQHWTIRLRSICPWSFQRTKKSIDVRLSLSFVLHLFVSPPRCLSSAWDDHRYNGISRTTTGLSVFSKRFRWDFLFLQADDSSFTYELIIVDDGSPDKTSEVRLTIASGQWWSVLCLQLALTYSARYGTDIVRVLTFDANRGKGGAVRMVR